MMTLRPLTLASAPLVDRLAHRSVAEGFRFVRRFAEQFAHTELDTPSQFYLGVFDGARLLAIGGVTPDPYLTEAGVGRIRHLYVLPEFRRQGIASRLMNELEARARIVYSKLRLRTDTATAAHFYERRGYLPTREPDATHVRQWMPES
jgi:GNAT superfamily N-acetyltransferase